MPVKFLFEKIRIRRAAVRSAPLYFAIFFHRAQEHDQRILLAFPDQFLLVDAINQRAWTLAD